MSTESTRSTRAPFTVQIFQFSILDWTQWRCLSASVYGVRAVIPAYMVLAVEAGSPQFDHIQKDLSFWWAVVQSFVPVFGCLRRPLRIQIHGRGSIAIKIVGYLINLRARFGKPLDPWRGWYSSRALRHTVHFLRWSHAVGTRTALFKPGIQGIIALQLTKTNSSTGWAVFYQLVNIGGFLGPFLAAWMRLLEWRWVFVSCALVVAINYICCHLQEPERAPPNPPFFELLWSIPGALQTSHVLLGRVFRILDDVLPTLRSIPNYIEDWVDSSMVLEAVIAPLQRRRSVQSGTGWCRLNG